VLLGVQERGKGLRYAGKVGTGFSRESLRELEARLGQRKTEASPFADRVPAAARAIWVRPELVAQGAFTEWTKDSRLRHPSFRGLREDKPPSEVVRESPAAADESPIRGVRLTHPDRVRRAKR
jgi:bifunctional non-homologous end joining protein LigD